jgi:hypothetical protein
MRINLNPSQAMGGFGSGGGLSRPAAAPRPSPIGGGLPKMIAYPMSFKKGGRVKKTGWAKVHKGERVIPAGAAGVMGGKAYPKGKRAKRKVKKTMDEWKAGGLRSGSKNGPKVTSQKQAVAIALSQARKG